MHTLLDQRSGKGRAGAFLSLLCLLLTANAFATDYYVATTGSDAANDGRSPESPYATIQKAAIIAYAATAEGMILRLLLLPRSPRRSSSIRWAYGDSIGGSSPIEVAVSDAGAA